MNPTDELREQLDTGYPHTLRPELHKALTARGIDYWVAQGITFWNRDDGCECLAYGYTVNGVPKLAIKVVGFITPEQAIAATLGRGTCHDKGTFNSWGFFTCSNCKVVVPVEAVREAPSIGKVMPISFCPNCGRKVVDA